MDLTKHWAFKHGFLHACRHRPTRTNASGEGGAVSNHGLAAVILILLIAFALTSAFVSNTPSSPAGTASRLSPSLLNCTPVCPSLHLPFERLTERCDLYPATFRCPPLARNAGGRQPPVSFRLASRFSRNPPPELCQSRLPVRPRWRIIRSANLLALHGSQSFRHFRWLRWVYRSQCEVPWRIPTRSGIAGFLPPLQRPLPLLCGQIMC
jgi:hypothetical protein